MEDINTYDRHCRMCAVSLRNQHYWSSNILKDMDYRVCEDCGLFHQQGDEENEWFMTLQDPCKGFPQPNWQTIQLTASALPWPGCDNTTKPIDHVEVFLFSTCPAHHYRRFQNWVANHTGLTSLKINFGSYGDQTDSIQAVVACLQASTSLQSACLELHCGFHFITQPAGQAIQELVKDCGSLKHLAIRLARTDAVVQLPTLTTDWFVERLFNALAVTRLQTFAYWSTRGISPFDSQNMTKACQAMVYNPHIRQIKVEDPRVSRTMANGQLALLAGDKLMRWTDRWASPNQSRLGDVLKDALEFPTMATSSLDKAPLLYHFLSERPDVLMGQSFGMLLDQILGPVRLQRKKPKRLSQQKKRGRRSTTTIGTVDKWYYCWCCQTHILGDTTFENHLQGDGHQNRLHETEDTKFHCWCCRKSIQGEVQWEDHLQSKSHIDSMMRALGSISQRKRTDPPGLREIREHGSNKACVPIRLKDTV